MVAAKHQDSLKQFTLCFELQTSKDFDGRHAGPPVV